MERIKTNKWCISRDEELFFDEYNTKEEAIAEGIDGYGYNMFYVGQIVELKFNEADMPDSENIIEQLNDYVYNECNVEDDWYENISREQEKELDKILAETILKWIDKNNLHPTCYGVDNVELIDIR